MHRTCEPTVTDARCWTFLVTQDTFPLMESSHHPTPSVLWECWICKLCYVLFVILFLALFFIFVLFILCSLVVETVVTYFHSLKKKKSFSIMFNIIHSKETENKTITDSLFHLRLTILFQTWETTTLHFYMWRCEA